MARMSDVTYNPTREHDNTSAHDILTSNITIRRKSIIPSCIIIQDPYLLHMYIYANGSYQYSNRLKLDLITILVNFTCAFG